MRLAENASLVSLRVKSTNRQDKTKQNQKKYSSKSLKIKGKKPSKSIAIVKERFMW